VNHASYCEALIETRLDNAKGSDMLMVHVSFLWVNLNISGLAEFLCILGEFV
jgi:delta-aminolevulinic acid dehydratase/porphobilinogen synthase